MSMTIYLNGKKEEVEEGMSIPKFIEIKKIRPEVVTVELNNEIIEKTKYQETVLKPNDRLEFVYYMGGGEGRGKVVVVLSPDTGEGYFQWNNILRLRSRST